MTTEQTAQQLELAAQILRTGHPFEVRHDASDRWHASLGVNPAQAVLQNWCLRPVLATPPDGRPLNNPDNLTAEAVGVGYRLTLKDDSCDQPHELWSYEDQMWVEGTRMVCTFEDAAYSYRLPLSVPWPEAPPFQLPPPPPGMSWHREDGWKEGDLPRGYRPLALGERFKRGDQVRDPSDYGWNNCEDLFIGEEPYNNCCAATRRSRTTRPLTFEHAGKTWTWHRPGDPMPCDPVTKICIWTGNAMVNNGNVSRLAGSWNWMTTTTGSAIIGWRFAEPATKEVELGPEDVMPGSVIRGQNLPLDWSKCWLAVLETTPTGVHCNRGNGYRFTSLQFGWQINRSLPLTGKWNPDAWEPCSKNIPA